MAACTIHKTIVHTRDDASAPVAHVKLSCENYLGATVGHIKVFPSTDARKRKIVMVGQSWVAAKHRRKGFGTALYEAAAQAACEIFGAPLASGESRSAAAEAFWRKQERKGRAQCTQESGSKKRPCIEYVLSCPAPTNLGKPRKRKR